LWYIGAGFWSFGREPVSFCIRSFVRLPAGGRRQVVAASICRMIAFVPSPSGGCGRGRRWIRGKACLFRNHLTARGAGRPRQSNGAMVRKSQKRHTLKIFLCGINQQHIDIQVLPNISRTGRRVLIALVCAV